MSEPENVCPNCKNYPIFIYGYLGTKRRYCCVCGLKEKLVHEYDDTRMWIKINGE